MTDFPTKRDVAEHFAYHVHPDHAEEAIISEDKNIAYIPTHVSTVYEGVIGATFDITFSDGHVEETLSVIVERKDNWKSEEE